MDRLEHTQIAAIQRYLHALDNADDTSLEAFGHTRHRHLSTHPEPEPNLRAEPKPPEPEEPDWHRPSL